VHPHDPPNPGIRDCSGKFFAEVELQLLKRGEAVMSHMFLTKRRQSRPAEDNSDL
jgi:hypothetical protein